MKLPNISADIINIIDIIAQVYGPKGMEFCS